MKIGYSRLFAFCCMFVHLSDASDSMFQNMMNSDNSSATTSSSSDDGSNLFNQLMGGDSSSSTSSSSGSSQSLQGFLNQGQQIQDEVNKEEKYQKAMQAKYEQFYLAGGSTVISSLQTSGLIKKYNQVIDQIGSPLEKTSLEKEVVDGYSSAFTQAVKAYQAAKLPIHINISNIAYSLFASICNIYSRHLQVLINTFTASTSKSDFLDQFSTIISDYQKYQSQVQTLAQGFPDKTAEYDNTTGTTKTVQATLRTDALARYDKKIAQFILPAVAQVINFISQKSDPSTYVSGIETMYNFITTTEALHVGVKGYASFDDYTLSLASSLADMYEKSAGMVEKQIDFVSKTADQNKAYLTTIYDEYTKAAELYKKLSGSKAQQNYILYNHKASTTKEKLDAISEGILKQSSGDSLVASVQAVMKNSSSTVAQLQEAATNIGQALTDYNDANTQFQVVKDVAAESIVLAKKSDAEGLVYLVGIRLLWAIFLENSSLGAGFLTKYFSQLSTNDDHYKIASSNFDNVMQALNDLCTTKDNPFMQKKSESSKVYILMYVQAAIKLYSDANLNADSSSKKSSSSSSAKAQKKLLGVLHNINTLINNLSNFSQAIVNLDDLALSKQIDQIAQIQGGFNDAMELAKNLDSNYASYKKVDEYISNLAEVVLSSGKKTFQEFLSQHIYYLLMNIAYDLTQQDKNILAMSYYNMLQGLSLSKAQLSEVADKISALRSKTNLVEHADTLLSQANASDKWAITSTDAKNSTWLNAISLYATAYSTEQGQVSSADLQKILDKYIAALQGYITAYNAAVPTAHRHDTDLFSVYNNLYYVFVSQNNASDLATVARSLMAIFSNSKSTGLFDVINTNLAVVNSSSSSSSEILAAQKSVEQAISTFNNLSSEQMQYVRTNVLMFHKSISPILASNKKSNGNLVLKLFVKGQKDISVTIKNLTSFVFGKYMTNGNSMFDQAETSEKDTNFTDASQFYTQAESEYKKVAESSAGAKLVDKAKQKYFLAQTRAQACLLAGMVQRAQVTSVGAIPDIALQYIISQYNIQIPLSLISTLPSSLAGLKSNQTSSVTAQMQSDVEMLLKIYVVSMLVSSQGFSYSQCYLPQSLTRISSLSQPATQVCDQAEKVASDFITQINNGIKTGVTIGKNTVKTSMEVKVIQPKTVIITLKNAQIPAINPVYQGGIYATQYYGAALLLFQPGTQIIHAGSISYVPGQDASTAQIMREYMAGTSVAAAQNHVTSAHNIALAIQKDIAALQAKNKEVDLSSYEDQYNQMKVGYQTALSLLMAKDGSAHAYYLANKMASYAQDVEDYVMTMYEQYAQDIKVMLVGDPTSQLYVSILRDLNVAYNTQKAVATSATIKQQLDVKIAEVFKNAGDACMSYVYKTLTAPSDSTVQLKLYRYFNAGPNYLAAKNKYKELKMSSDEAAMNAASVEADAKSAALNLLQYMFVKKYGTSYKDTLSGSYVTVSFSKLMSDYADFQNQYSLSSSSAMPTGELEEYNQTRSLLLDGIMYFTSSANEYQALPGGNTSSSDADKAVNTYLQAQGVAMEKQESENPAAKKDKSAPATITKNVPVMKDDDNCGKIENLAIKGLVNFAGKNADIAAFLTTLHRAASYLYIYDYLGGVKPSKDAQTETKEWSNKFQLLEQAQQAEGTRLQNPSSAYVG